MSDWRQTNPNNRKKPQWDQNDIDNLNNPYNTTNNPHNQKNANNPSTSDKNKFTPKPLTTLIKIQT